jgi:hypothetical protein
MLLQQRRSHKDIPKWIREKGLVNNKGLPIEFKHHGFMNAFLTDDCNRIVCRKCTQVGATFTTVLKILYIGEESASTVVYTLPTGPEAKSFVLTKFDPIIERSPGLRKLIQRNEITKKELFNTTVKRIGPSHFIFKGSYTTWGAQSIDADVLVVDELDFQKEDVRKMFEERIEGSGSKDIIYWIGYPSVPNFGIEELYDSSDQREWFIECPTCLKRQTLSWPDSINMATQTFKCKHCQKLLPDMARMRGLWKARFPGRPIHGYHINKLMAPWISAERIIDRFNKDTARKFHNYTLGLPYTGSDSALDDKVIEDMMMDPVELMMFKQEKKPLTVIGIDQGDEFFVVKSLVTEDLHVVEDYEIFSSEEEVRKYIEKQDAFLTVMDMSPNTHLGRKLQEHFTKEKFWLADEQNRASTLNMNAFYEFRHSDSRLAIQRSEGLDIMYDDMTNRKIRVSSAMTSLRTKSKQDPGYLDMLLNLVPDVQERFGRAQRVWKPIGPDHLAHATLFINTATRLLYPTFGAKEQVRLLAEPKPDTPWYVQDFEDAMGIMKGDKVDYKLILPKGIARKRAAITPREI